MKIVTVFLLTLIAPNVFAQPAPALSSWILNATGKTGYGGIESNIQKVQYSDSAVYISCTCIPGYDIGPWPGNPNTPKNQNFVFKIVRDPQPNLGTLTATPLGHIGVWSNGVSIFNAKDARSYNNGGVWNQNAVVVEGSSFDECLGHPAPNGEYHHHLNPVCLYNDNDSTHHSPIIGYAFDGYPIYGAYGFSATENAKVTRMRSSYRRRNITDRTTLANGTKLSANQYGPAISTQYPLGYYLEDFEYVPDLGDLDSNNGRVCVTPEYPQGTYAYFVTIDENGNAVYPYTFGPNYHGIVTTADVGPGSGHVTISEAVLQYTGSSNASASAAVATGLSVYPNPTSDWIVVDYSSASDYITKIVVTDLRGSEIYTANATGPTTYIPVSNIVCGTYFVRITTSSGATSLQKLVKD